MCRTQQPPAPNRGSGSGAGRRGAPGGEVAGLEAAVQVLDGASVLDPGERCS
jgi:hypothetical protein